MTYSASCTLTVGRRDGPLIWSPTCDKQTALFISRTLVCSLPTLRRWSAMSRSAGTGQTSARRGVAIYHPPIDRRSSCSTFLGIFERVLWGRLLTRPPQCTRHSCLLYGSAQRPLRVGHSALAASEGFVDALVTALFFSFCVFFITSLRMSSRGSII